MKNGKRQEAPMVAGHLSWQKRRRRNVLGGDKALFQYAQ